MELETVRQVTLRAAEGVEEEQQRVFAWLRRHTNLRDDEELRVLLKPLAEAAFNGGHEIGWTEAMWKAEGIRLRNKVLWMYSFVMSAAIVAGWLMDMWMP